MRFSARIAAIVLLASLLAPGATVPASGQAGYPVGALARALETPRASQPSGAATESPQVEPVQTLPTLDLGPAPQRCFELGSTDDICAPVIDGVPNPNWPYAPNDNYLNSTYYGQLYLSPHIVKPGQDVDGHAVTRLNASIGWSQPPGDIVSGCRNGSGQTPSDSVCIWKASGVTDGWVQWEIGFTGFFGTGVSADYYAVDQKTVISGTVSDTNGNPVPGSAVSISGPTSGTAVTDKSGFYSAVVEAGSYSVSASAQVDGVSLPATATDCFKGEALGSSCSISVGDNDGTANFKVAGQEIVGKVVDAHNVAQSGVTMEVSGTTFKGTAVKDSTATASDGSYQVVLEPGDYVVEVRLPSSPPDLSALALDCPLHFAPALAFDGTETPSCTVDLRPGESAREDFKLVTQGIAGTVVDLQNKPATSLTLDVTGTDNDGHKISTTTTTGSDGTYDVDLAPGKYTVTPQLSSPPDGTFELSHCGGSGSKDGTCRIDLGPGQTRGADYIFEGPPLVTSLSLTTAPLTGGEEVTVKGENFVGDSIFVWFIGPDASGSSVGAAFESDVRSHTESAVTVTVPDITANDPGNAAWPRGVGPATITKLGDQYPAQVQVDTFRNGIKLSSQFNGDDQFTYNGPRVTGIGQPPAVQDTSALRDKSTDLSALSGAGVANPQPLRIVGQGFGTGTTASFLVQDGPESGQSFDCTSPDVIDQSVMDCEIPNLAAADPMLSSTYKSYQTLFGSQIISDIQVTVHGTGNQNLYKSPLPGDQFSFELPLLGSVLPASGPLGSAPPLTVTGAGFEGVKEVEFVVLASNGTTETASYPAASFDTLGNEKIDVVPPRNIPPALLANGNLVTRIVVGIPTQEGEILSPVSGYDYFVFTPPAK
jgi:hypothetical protein